MILGLIVALGTSKLWVISLGITLWYVIVCRKRFHIPLSIWLIIGLIGITALWSIQPGKPVAEIIAIFCATIALQTLPRRHFSYGIASVIALQIGIGIYEYFHGVIRIHGLDANASVMGLSGLFLLPSIPAAVLTGLSLSRTAMCASVLMALLYRSRKMVIACILTLAIGGIVGLIVAPERYTIHIADRDLTMRVDAIKAKSRETLPADIPAVTNHQLESVSWRWYGCGYGQYVFKTGQIQPHNIFVRAWYELGLLSLPLAGSLLWLWWRYSRDWKLLAVVCAVGMLTDELYGSIAGIYMLSGFAIMRSMGAPLPNRARSAVSVNRDSPGLPITDPQ